MADLIPWWNMLAPPPAPYDPMKAAQVQRYQQQTQQQNALRGLFGNPQNYDQGGQLKPNVLPQIGAVDPGTMIETQNALSTNYERQMRAQTMRNNVREEEEAKILRATQPVDAEYRDLIAKGMAPEDALRRAREKEASIKADLLPTVSIPDLRKAYAESSGYNPQLYQQRLIQNKFTRQDLAEARSEAKDERAERHTQFSEGLARQDLDIRRRAEARAEDGAPEGFVGTLDGKLVNLRGRGGRYFDPSGQDVTETVSNPHKVGTERQRTPQQQVVDKYMEEHPTASADELAGFLEKMRPARSGPAAAVRKFMEENPKASAAEVASFNAWIRETGAGAQAFGSGAQGNLTRAQNVAIDHLGALSDDLIPALGNGDLRAVNALKNWAKTEFGYEGPVDFNFAKGIVSQEVNKSIVNVGAGTEEERRNLSKSLSDANSPEQLAGVIATAKRLMAGQLKGLQQQYVDVTVPPGQRGDGSSVARARESFQQKLFPRTLRELSVDASSSTGPPGGKPLAEVAIPPAPAAASGAAGVIMVPRQMSREEQVKARRDAPAGTTFKFEDGSTWTKP